MLAQEIFDRAMALVLAEDADKGDYRPHFPRILNILLLETFEANNAQLKNDGKEPLAVPFVVTSMQDNVPYSDSFTGTVLPYGVAGRLFMDDDRGIATELLNKYEYLRGNEKKARLVPIKEHY